MPSAWWNKGLLYANIAPPTSDDEVDDDEEEEEDDDDDEDEVEEGDDEVLVTLDWGEFRRLPRNPRNISSMA